jgi:phosphoenolpyruvate carboxykinase (GTP)
VAQARAWPHGVFLGATLSSETTAAATGAVGVVRRDPMAMLPFLGYAADDYFAHWLQLGAEHPEGVPAIFYVNWFRRSPAGDFLWPGFGENSRVLKWIVERLEGRAQAVETPVGSVPSPTSLDVDGLNLPPEALQAVLTVDAEEWRAELALIEDWFAMLGPRLPAALRTELDSLTDRLGSDLSESLQGR